ncbi:MAG: alpha/beta hydrolase [Armatimonadota bacterium]
MSLLHVHYFSTALQKASGMYVVLPEGDGPFPVVYMLHGLSDDYTIWLRRTSIERYAEQLGLMIVMPDGGRSFYTDCCGVPANYEQHMLETVAFIDKTFHTINGPEGRGIGGLSMGGYGAMKLGLKHPNLFGSIVAHSGALDIAMLLRSSDLSSELQVIFGNTLDPADDCFALATRVRPKPAIYFDCGKSDFLLEHNRDFRAHLKRLEAPHVYKEYRGDHNWAYWDAHVTTGLEFHQQHFAECAAASAGLTETTVS